MNIFSHGTNGTKRSAAEIDSFLSGGNTNKIQSLPKNKISLVPGSKTTVYISGQIDSYKPDLEEIDSEKEFVSFTDIKTVKNIEDLINKPNHSSVKGWGGIGAAFVVVRTDNLKDFCKDLFLPLFVNHILKIENVALRIFAAIPALVFDLITLIPRLLIAPGRVLYNSCKEVQLHPLMKLILDYVPVSKIDLAKSALKNGILKIRIRKEDIKISKKIDLEGIHYVGADQQICNKSYLIAIKELPGNRNGEADYINRNAYRLNNIENEEWIPEGCMWPEGKGGGGSTSGYSY